MINIPFQLQNILDTLINKGAKPIVVGGFVRDYFLKIDSKDIDVEVYGLDTLEELSNILQSFGEVSFVGKSFGVLKLKTKNNHYDFSFPRTENKTGVGHTGFDVKIDGSMSYDEGARRRDFTINSIGYDYKQKGFLDPFGGLKDIEDKVLRHIDEKTFCEDPLRVYRGIQFCARFEFDLDTSTKELFKTMIKKEEFKTLPKERIYEEYKKLLLKSNKPSIGLNLLNSFDIEKISSEAINSIDKLVKIKSDNEKENLVLLFFYIDDILKKVSEDIKLQRDINNLKNFIVPKIFENQLEDIDSKELLLKKKFFMMKNMPKPFIEGKDLQALGMKEGKEFGVILKKLYQAQMNGEFYNKEDALNYLKKLL